MGELAIAPSFVVLGYIIPIFRYLEFVGEDLAPYLALLDLAPEDLRNFDLQIPDESMGPLLQLAEERTGDSNIGLRAGCHFNLGNIGLIGQLVLTCGLARQVFDLHKRYYGLIGNGSVQRFIYSEEEVTIELSRAPGLPPFTRHYFEFSLASWASMARSVVGERYSPSRIEFPVAGPADTQAQEEVFGCPVEYGRQDRAVVRFPVAFADIELFADNPPLRQALEGMANKQLLALQGEQSDSDPLVAQIKQSMGQRLAFGTPTVEQVAQDLGCSVRVLQRQLSERQRRFSDVLDLVRKQRTEHMLGDSSLSLVDVALMLGFSEQSSFQRAFKRWFGMTPAAYRRVLI